MSDWSSDWELFWQIQSMLWRYACPHPSYSSPKADTTGQTHEQASNEEILWHARLPEELCGHTLILIAYNVGTGWQKLRQGNSSQYKMLCGLVECQTVDTKTSAWVKSLDAPHSVMTNDSHFLPPFPPLIFWVIQPIHPEIGTATGADWQSTNHYHTSHP